jgi:hypothetical protein
MPWSNAGCLGLKVGEDYKGDIFWSPYFGLYINDGIFRRWYSLPRFKLLKIQVIDPENARRIFSRTMKPWVRLKTWNRNYEVEAVSYPFLDEHGAVRIKVRMVPGDPTTLSEIGCSELNPIDFRKKTGIPACDPIVYE